MCILQIRPGVSLKGKHTRPIECVASSSAGCKVLHHDCTDSNLIGNMIRIRDLRVLCRILTHLLVHGIPGLVEDVVEKDNVTFSRRHSLHHSIADVFKAIRIIKFEQLECAKELRNMEILLRSNQVKYPIKLVSLPS